MAQIASYLAMGLGGHKPKPLSSYMPYRESQIEAEEVDYSKMSKEEIRKRHNFKISEK